MLQTQTDDAQDGEGYDTGVCEEIENVIELFIEKGLNVKMQME